LKIQRLVLSALLSPVQLIQASLEIQCLAFSALLSPTQLIQASLKIQDRLD